MRFKVYLMCAAEPVFIEADRFQIENDQIAFYGEGKRVDSWVIFTSGVAAIEREAEPGFDTIA
ncbi:MAG TPA: hypothetical protein VKN18_11580 [Blastocatellia bacterium]|nr:hypothetical protein [Blastocatellia bacterium]